MGMLTSSSTFSPKLTPASFLLSTPVIKIVIPFLLTKFLYVTLPHLLRKPLASDAAQLTKERTKTSARLDGLYGLDGLHKPQLFQARLVKFFAQLFQSLLNTLKAINHFWKKFHYKCLTGP